MSKMVTADNRDFKHIVQDISHIYVGGRMTMQNYMEYEDVPFKVKAISNKYFLPKAGIDGTIVDYFANLSKEEFDFQVVKQLKLKVKAGFWEEKIDRKGNPDKRYVSKTYSPEEYMDLLAKRDDILTEELIFNKLALMTFSS